MHTLYVLYELNERITWRRSSETTGNIRHDTQNRHGGCAFCRAFGRLGGGFESSESTKMKKSSYCRTEDRP